MGNLIKSLSIEECKAEINKIRDKDVKNFIFNFNHNSSSFLMTSTEIATYFNNIMIICFMYIYGKYLMWRKRENKSKLEQLSKSSNFMRIITTFEKLYSSFALSYEFIENTLADIQILLNAKDHSKYTQELGIDGDFAMISDFSECIFVARTGRYSTRALEKDVGILRAKLINFLKMAPFIKEIDIEHSDFENKILDKNGQPLETQFQRLDCAMNVIGEQGEFDASYSFLFDPDSFTYYYLNSVEEKVVSAINKSKCLVLTYNSVGVFSDSGASGQKLYIVIKNINDEVHPTMANYYLTNIDVDVNVFKNKYFGITATSGNHIISDFNSINFRYIRILSLAISDILDEETKMQIYKEYSSRAEYKNLFNENSSNVNDLLSNGHADENGYGWDVVIAIILIQESAKKFLYFLFKGHSSRYEYLLTNLEYRFGKKLIDCNELISLAKDKFNAELTKNNVEAYGDRNGVSFRKYHVNEDMARAKIEASIIVHELSKITYSNEMSGNGEFSFPLSIKSRRKIVGEISEYDYVSEEQKVETLKKLVCQTLKYFYLFYRGFFGYGAVKMKFERQSIIQIFTREAVLSEQEKAEQAFKDGAEAAACQLRQIKDNDVRSVMMLIKQLNKECSYPDKQDSYNELLSQLLGREFLVDYNSIAKLEDCFELYADPESELGFSDLTNIVKSSLDYLATGRYGKKLNPKNNVIFPTVAYLDYASKTRDGYDVYQCSITGESENDKDYKIISEFMYKSNTSIYCLPNVSRSNDSLKLWIEPIVIESSLVSGIDIKYEGK